jgi:alkanesulfonate monooxygenase SsuD/methylene tetrahydromethanopterin reductase-like flavin-dependent oxidoreductase (luciferase family)
MDAPTVAGLVSRLRSAAAAASEAEHAAVLAFDELLARAARYPDVHAALAQYWSARTGSGAAICGHIGQVADALDEAADELEHDDLLVTGALS